MTAPMPLPSAGLMEQVSKIVGSISAGYLQEAQVNASNKINEANTFASNLIRAANNNLRGSRAGLARFVQAENNKRVLANTGSAMETTQVNARRQRDAATANDFESQIAFAEQAGAQAAAAAFSGLTGGVADIVNGTSALRRERIAQRTKEATKFADFDTGKRISDIAQAGWDSLDFSEIGADIDYSKDVATKQAYGGNLFSEILGGVDAKSMANLLGSTGGSYDAFADRAGGMGTGSAGQRTITGGR